MISDGLRAQEARLTVGVDSVGAWIGAGSGMLSSSVAGGDRMDSGLALVVTVSSDTEGAGTDGVAEEDATAAAAAAAYRMGGRAAFGAGGSTFACVFSTTGEGAILISIVLFLEGCFLAETGLGGCSSGT